MRQPVIAPANRSGVSPSTRCTALAPSTAIRTPATTALPRDGSVTFLDFGLVKRWTPGEWQQLAPSLDAIVVHRDPERLVAVMEEIGFLRRGHGLAPQQVYDYVSTPYTPYLVDTFTFTRQFVRDAMATIIDVKGPHAGVIEKLNMPPSFVILDRVVWGVSAILGQVGGDRAMAVDVARISRRWTSGHAAWRSRTGMDGDNASQHSWPSALT